jgi:hypothetical protein
MGILDYNSISELQPLNYNDSFQAELEKLDNLPVRECLTVLVLLNRHSEESSDSFLYSSDAYSKEFEVFLWSLGCQINLKTHLGYKGNMNEDNCNFTPYYADLHIEIIFNCPYLYKRDTASKQQSSNSKKFNGYYSSTDDLHSDFSLRSKKARFRSQSVVESSFLELDNRYETENDSIGIVWLEDIQHLKNLVHMSPSKLLIILIVHPLMNSPGLYWIKIIIKPELPEYIKVVFIL